MTIEVVPTERGLNATKRLLVVATITIIGNAPRDADAQCTQFKIRQEEIDETVHSSPLMCCINGWRSFGEPVGGGLACGDPGTLCTKIRIRADIVSCTSGVTSPGGVVACFPGG